LALSEGRTSQHSTLTLFVIFLANNPPRPAVANKLPEDSTIAEGALTIVKHFMHRKWMLVHASPTSHFGIVVLQNGQILSVSSIHF
jgi:hypothetical protein